MNKNDLIRLNPPNGSLPSKIKQYEIEIIGTARKNKIKFTISLGNLKSNDFLDIKNITQQEINNGTFSPNNLSAGSKTHDNKNAIKKNFKI